MENYIEHIAKNQNIILALIQSVLSEIFKSLTQEVKLNHQRVIIQILKKIIERFQHQIENLQFTSTSRDLPTTLATLIKFRYLFTQLKHSVLITLLKNDLSFYVSYKNLPLKLGYLGVLILSLNELLEKLSFNPQGQNQGISNKAQQNSSFIGNQSFGYQISQNQELHNTSHSELKVANEEDISIIEQIHILLQKLIEKLSQLAHLRYILAQYFQHNGQEQVTIQDIRQKFLIQGFRLNEINLFIQSYNLNHLQILNQILYLSQQESKKFLNLRNLILDSKLQQNLQLFKNTSHFESSVEQTIKIKNLESFIHKDLEVMRQIEQQFQAISDKQANLSKVTLQFFTCLYFGNQSTLKSEVLKYLQEIQGSQQLFLFIQESELQEFNTLDLSKLWKTFLNSFKKLQIDVYKIHDSKYTRLLQSFTFPLNEPKSDVLIFGRRKNQDIKVEELSKETIQLPSNVLDDKQQIYFKICILRLSDN